MVYNNRLGGQDEELLKLFGEPSWNFQVVRFLDGNGSDIIARKDLVWTISELASRMMQVLQQTNRPIPDYLRAVALENDYPRLEEAVFSMACFWTGEYKIGKIEGVVATETGWFDSREVTKVTFHNEVVSLDRLVDRVAEEKCADRAYLRADQDVDTTSLPVFPFVTEKYQVADETDQKKQLNAWPELARLHYLTPMQKMILNAWGPDERSRAIKILSPRQKRELMN